MLHDAEDAASRSDCLIKLTMSRAERYSMATKERLAAMAASRCAVCSGAMVLTLVNADPTNGAFECRTYICGECGHSQTYSVDADDS